ncbi:hypothetical protein F511_42086 [Dorcoceras hygrometricum]|uniref:DUF3741 domain-containing protein n=2 Tax=Dorcoceras hygrometricum TaxID=472368 RepID=A0A2Z6ZZ89_9LAMI|nr:hypothetical protein F511_42086 [Dorcoceras hygrometricum]
MKDFSLFLLKNALGAKMKKGFRNFCNNEISTSTLDQSTPSDRRTLVREPQRHETLEEMILKLEMEERMNGRSKVVTDDGEAMVQHRMSCVNSSDILRSARKALDQYPRFSLDGKDSMYRCSFANLGGPVERSDQMLMAGGESVVWCNPGVVARLMGLDAIPVPARNIIRRDRLIKRHKLKRTALAHYHQASNRKHEYLHM